MKIGEKYSLDKIGSLKHVMLLMFEYFLLVEDELLKLLHWLYDFI